jgi:hypothetical protein
MADRSDTNSIGVEVFRLCINQHACALDVRLGEEEYSLSKVYLPVSGQCLGEMTALGLFTRRQMALSHRDDERFHFFFLQTLHKDEGRQDTNSPSVSPRLACDLHYCGRRSLEDTSRIYRHHSKLRGPSDYERLAFPLRVRTDLDASR